MNDKFTEALRQHFLDTANERPADGQLAAVQGAVAVTTQRHPLLARRPWAAPSAGPLSLALRFGLVAVALAGAIVGGLIIAGGGTGPDGRTPFQGTWTTVDTKDGSRMFLVVAAGPTPEVQFIDDRATGPACARDEVKVFTAAGRGVIDGNTLDTRWPHGGGCGLAEEPVARGSFVRDEATDRLLDNLGNTWLRDEAAAALPTRGPLPSRDPSGASDAKCFDIAAGGTYTNHAGSLSLTVTIPATAEFGWQGYRDAFEVAGFCDLGRPILLQATVVAVTYAACDTGTGVAVTTPAAAVAELSDPQGYEISAPTAVTVAGYPATQFVLRGDASSCADGIQLWEGGDVRANTNAVVYVVDVDGISLGITLQERVGDGAPEAQMAEAEAILASLRIQP